MAAHPAYPAVYNWAGQYANVGGSWPTDNNIYVFFDSNGTELSNHRKRQGCSHEHLANTMSAILKQKGKGIPLKDYAKVKNEFSIANHLYNVGAWYEAHKAYEKLAKKKYKPEPQMVKTSKQRVKEIEKKVTELLKEVQDKIEGGDKAQGLVELHVLRARCKGLRIVAEITKAISGLEKDKAVSTEQKKKASSEEKACKTYLRAEKYAAEGNDKSAKSMFEQVKKVYKESSFAEKAEERLIAFQ